MRSLTFLQSRGYTRKFEPIKEVTIDISEHYSLEVKTDDDDRETTIVLVHSAYNNEAGEDISTALVTRECLASILKARPVRVKK